MTSLPPKGPSWTVPGTDTAPGLEIVPEPPSPRPPPPRTAPRPPAPPPVSASSGRGWLWTISLALIGFIVASFVLALVARLFFVQAYFVPSGSMIPTLDVQDRVLVNKRSYASGEVGRGEIIVFTRPEGTSGDVDDLLKRVVGLAGETIAFQNGNVFIDGQLVQESYIAEPDSTFPIAGMPGCEPAGTSTQCTIPDDHVFVLGDNRRGSTDGRVFGPIPEDSIVGQAVLKIFPSIESL